MVKHCSWKPIQVPAMGGDVVVKVTMTDCGHITDELDTEGFKFCPYCGNAIAWYGEGEIDYD